MLLLYPIGGKTLLFIVGCLLMCSVTFPTIDKCTFVAMFLILVGRLVTSLVKEGLISSFLSSISLIR